MKIIRAEMISIETPQLLLRPIVEGDASDIYAYSRNPNVGINAGWHPHASIEETREVMKVVFLGQENVFGIVLRESGVLFGSIGLAADPKRQNDKARMIGYALGEEYWGCGYAAEAVGAMLRFGFEELDLDLISAYCYACNTRSARVLTKCGFRHEGRLRQSDRRYDGAVLDSECYSITKSEYV